MIEEKKLMAEIESREKAYQRAWERYDDEEAFGGMNACGSIIAYIEDMPKLNRWIPCSERLPEDDRMVLVTCCTKKGVRNVNRAYYEGGFWHGSGSMSGVVAWQPLPEPWE